jgi:hypothetical protein
MRLQLLQRQPRARLQTPSDFALHAQRERALIIEAKRRRAEAEARLLNLEVIRRALVLLLTLVGVALMMARLLPLLEMLAT